MFPTIDLPAASSTGFRVLLRTSTPTLARGFLALGPPESDLELATCDASATELLERVGQWRPSVILLDTPAHVDFATLAEIRRRCPGCATVLWTDSIPVEVAHQARAAGVRGVLRKDSPDSLVLLCLRKVAQGEPWFDRALLNSLLDVREVRLSPRERQLLRLVALGLSNKQLAGELMLSEGTVKAYLAKLFRKVGVHDRYELAMHGLRSIGFSGIQPDASNLVFTSTVVLGAGPRTFAVPEPAGRVQRQ